MPCEDIVFFTVFPALEFNCYFLLIFFFPRKEERQQLQPVRALRWKWKIQEVQKKRKLQLLVSRKIVLTVTRTDVAGYLG